MLKNAICIRGPTATDNIWMTCCALHNFLLEEDGLDNPWDSPVPVESWLDPKFADHSNADLRRVFGIESISNAHRELDTTAIGLQPPAWSNGSNQSFDSGANDRQLPEDPPAVPAGNSGHAGSIPVNSLSQEEFRDSLIKHFDVLFCQDKLKWPRRSGGVPSSVPLPKAWAAVAGNPAE